MKLRFECKLILTEYIEGLLAEDVYSRDEIVKNLADELKKNGVTSNGTVTVEDAKLTIEER